MVSVHDVAAYILQKKRGEMTTMKLQKLVYYCQAWSLVWDETPLFAEKIEAWTSGPVVRELYDQHRGMFLVDKWPQGNPGKLAKRERDTVDRVIEFYGEKTAQWLSDLTHLENPWREARAGLAAQERGHRVITHPMMHEYYSSIVPTSQGN